MARILQIISLVIVFNLSFANANTDNKYQTAIFAGGCFWCLESDFEYMQKDAKLSHDGIISIVSGYDGGGIKNPTYTLVSAGNSGYKETVQVTYDPSKISYNEIVEYFYRRINPTDDGGQFCDRGKQYQSAIYYTSDNQKQIAENVTQKLSQVFSKHNEKVYTDITASTHFYPAEKYHQDYHHKNPKRYCYYRTGCARDATINKVWDGVEWNYTNIVPFDVPSSYAACLNR